MSLNDDILAINEDPPSVIKDSLKFKVKLDIGEEAYTYLNNARNFLDWLGSLGAGVGTGSFAGMAWYTTLGIFSKAALVIGLTTTPVGWFIGAGALGAITVYAGAKFKRVITKKEEDQLYTKIPKYINTPLDILGVSLCALLLPVAMKVAKSDGTLCEKEYAVITNYLVDEWGYHPDYIKNAMIEQDESLDFFDYYQYGEVLIQATNHHNEIKIDVLERELLRFLNDIINADGEAKPEEVAEINRLKEVLRTLGKK